MARDDAKLFYAPKATKPRLPRACWIRVTTLEVVAQLAIAQSHLEVVEDDVIRRFLVVDAAQRRTGHVCFQVHPTGLCAPRRRRCSRSRARGGLGEDASPRARRFTYVFCGRGAVAETAWCLRAPRKVSAAAARRERVHVSLSQVVSSVAQGASLLTISAEREARSYSRLWRRTGLPCSPRLVKFLNFLGAGSAC